MYKTSIVICTFSRATTRNLATPVPRHAAASSARRPRSPRPAAARRSVWAAASPSARAARLRHERLCPRSSPLNTPRPHLARRARS
eukprot:scaffold103498_cov67-Phaeocystis_antarctica.AAC.3